MEPLVKQEAPGKMAPQEHLDHEVIVVKTDLQENQEMLVQSVYQVNLVHEVIKEPRVSQVRLVPQDRKDYQGSKEPKESKDHKV